MTREEILATLQSVAPELRARGVNRAALFGSVARGEAHPDSDSDIDIMVEIDPDKHIGVFGFVEVVKLIEDLFQNKVDVSERQSLRPFVRPSAERDAIYAF